MAGLCLRRAVWKLARGEVPRGAGTEEAPVGQADDPGRQVGRVQGVRTVEAQVLRQGIGAREVMRERLRKYTPLWLSRGGMATKWWACLDSNQGLLLPKQQA